MAPNQQNDSKDTGKNAMETPTPDSETNEIDRDAPAGDPNSLGAQSVRDGRPATDDRTVEAMDEMGPGVIPPLTNDKTKN